MFRMSTTLAKHTDAAGAHEPPRRVLLLSTAFDGCAYGLQNDNGTLVKKPWRVITNEAGIAEIDHKR